MHNEWPTIKFIVLFLIKSHININLPLHNSRTNNDNKNKIKDNFKSNLNDILKDNVNDRFEDNYGKL